ncbi:MAG: hypothetical protein HYX48_06420 [Chlamydiales bacterium]|nr:hypothetical protein [Chlamydiales bacterium]
MKAYLNLKSLLGGLLFAIGIALIALAIRGMHRFNAVKGTGEEITNFFTKNPMWNPLITFFGGTPQMKPVAHDAPDTVMLIIGILAVIAGVAFTYINRPRRFFF